MAVHEEYPEAVVPLEGPYAQVVSQLHHFERNLGSFDARF
jgi:hypothetical protein